MGYEDIKLRRKQIKAELVDIMGGQCIICGYDRNQRALEFHHIDPSTKSFALSQSTKYFKREDLFKELQKCCLVCANCHREIEDGDISAEQIFSSYSEEKAKKYLVLEEEWKVKNYSYCVDCGEKISSNAKRCADCHAKSVRKVGRPTREALKQMIRNESFTSIARKYEVTDNAIRKWCSSKNLPTRKKDIKNYSDEEWLKI